MMGHGPSVLTRKDVQEVGENGLDTEGIVQPQAITNNSNAAIRPVDISSKWGNLLAYELFNQIQNMMSVFVFDSRPLVDNEAVRIQGSLFLPAEVDDNIEGLQTIICDFLKNRNSRTNKIGILLILSDGTQIKQLTDLITFCIEFANGTIALDLDGIVPEKGFLCTCNLLASSETDKFFERYALCSLFMENSSLPKTKKNTYACYPNEIVENFLFLGDQTHGREARYTQSLGITHIIDVTNKQSSKSHCEEYNINYLAINIADREEEAIEEHFETIRTFLQPVLNAYNTTTVVSEPKKMKVLIHCWAGISRSTTMVLACLMFGSGSTRMTLKQAVEHVASQRPMIHPNDGFMQKLMNLELSLFQENSIATNDEFLEVIKKKARYWSQAATLENDFDRVPIAAWKNRVVDDMVDVETESENKAREAKEKREFLKRGQDKTIVKAASNPDSIENMNSNNVPMKKDGMKNNSEKPWLKKKKGIVRSNSVKAGADTTELPAPATKAVSKVSDV